MKLRCLFARRSMDVRFGRRVVGCGEPFSRWRLGRNAHRSHIPGVHARCLLKGFFTSIRVMNAVVLDHQTKGGERLLLLCLARYAAHDGSRVFPSVATLSDETQQTRRAVQYQLRSLEAKGLLRRIGDSDYGTTDYCIAVDKLTGAQDVRPQKRKSSVAGAQMPTKGGAPRSPESSSIRQENRQELLEPPHVKSPQGEAAMKAIEAFLPKFKSAYREAK